MNKFHGIPSKGIEGTSKRGPSKVMNKLKTAMAGVLLAGFAVQYVAAAPSYVMQHNTSIEEALKKV